MFKTINERKVNYGNGTFRMIPTLEIDIENKKVRIEECISSTCACINHSKYGTYNLSDCMHLSEVKNHISNI